MKPKTRPHWRRLFYEKFKDAGRFTEEGPLCSVLSCDLWLVVAWDLTNEEETNPEEEELPDIDDIPTYTPASFSKNGTGKSTYDVPSNSGGIKNGGYDRDDAEYDGMKVSDDGTGFHDAVPSGSKSSGKKVTSASNAVGVVDSDGFLAPPPASTLLIRRTRTSSTGSSTYIISPPTPMSVDTPPTKRRLSSSDINQSSKSKRRSSLESKGGGQSSFSKDLSNSSSGSHKYSKNIAKLKKGMKDKGQQNRKDMMKRVGKIKEKLKVKNPVNIDPTTGKRRYKRRSTFSLHPKQLKHSSYHFPEPLEPEYEEYGTVASLTWRPNDDLRLIVNALQTNDLKQVHMGVKFSCRYTLNEIRNRWKCLLYEDKISKVSTTACRNVHSKVKRRIYSEALFSQEELNILQAVKSTDNPTTETFELILRDNLLTFHPYRTAKSLQKCWTELKDLNMLDDQDIKKSFEDGGENFADFENLVDDSEVRNLHIEPSVLEEIIREDRRNKKRIRMLEEEISTWQDLAELVWEGQIAKAPQFDDNTFAILRGKNVRFAMAAKEITLGRRTENNWVDADLSEEGNDFKVSRRQATIKMRALGDFVILNQGKHSMYIDGQALLPGEVASLHDQSVIKVSQLNFVFIVNDKLLYDLRKKILEEESNAEHVDVQNTQQPSKSKEPSSSRKNTSKESHSKLSVLDLPGSINPSPWSRVDSVIISPKKSKSSNNYLQFPINETATTLGKNSGQAGGEKPLPKKPAVKRPKKPRIKIDISQPPKIPEPPVLPPFPPPPLI
ncbi:unnamed protein product [Allacma fusca]|uniref:FHA domain-containing protein n=1 Tax=Allacma fusca TaxID=39272 RepID=A0A8J2KM04_9HEXA|nr:unnamed protein product [Allacma fusca]